MLYSTLVLVTPSALVSPRTAARRAWHHCDAAWRRAAAATARRAAGAAAVARSAARPEALAAGVVRGRAAPHHRRLRARRRRIPWQHGAAAKSVRGGSALRASPLALVATARRWRREGAVGCAAPSAPLRARSRWCEQRRASSCSAAWLRPYSSLAARAVGARASRGASPTRYSAQRAHLHATPCALAEAAGAGDWRVGGREFCEVSTVPPSPPLLPLPPPPFFFFSAAPRKNCRVSRIPQSHLYGAIDAPWAAATGFGGNRALIEGPGAEGGGRAVNT